MRTFIFIHRWLGVGFCLLFAMWFASGIVMHFVPFPALTEAERVGGLAAIELVQAKHGPAEAVRAAGLGNVTRARLWQRADGPIYLVNNDAAVRALHAADLSPAAVKSESLALVIAVEHARLRGMDTARAAFVELADYDQWTVPNGLDLHRPLFRVALNDRNGTELYVSSTTGEVVRDTTRSERAWNYAGSVVHWIYPTALRRDWRVWNVVVWWLSLVAMLGVASGVIVGLTRVKVRRGRLVSPYKRWHGWHHWLGLGSMLFVSTWILSGWLSMDHGRLFTEGHVSDAEARQIIGNPDWSLLPRTEPQRASAATVEIEWFAFGGRIYRRDRTALAHQRLSLARSDQDGPLRAVLDADEVSSAVHDVRAGCMRAAVVADDDSYALKSEMPDAPVYRAVCGEVWYQIDGASGAFLEKLDPSRRAYRWVYSALHTMDVPALMARPELRTFLIIALCAIGLAFSVTGIVIAWRRLRLHFWRPAN